MIHIILMMHRGSPWYKDLCKSNRRNTERGEHYGDKCVYLEMERRGNVFNYVYLEYEVRHEAVAGAKGEL